MKEHYIIPVFIPEAACPNKCIYCNQGKITGISQKPETATVSLLIKKRLLQIPADARNIQIAFFGGNFTGLEINEQKELLAVAAKFIDGKRVASMRISTRPDYIDIEKLTMLMDYGVRNIELGAQSMFDDVLLQSSRGHTINDTVRASELIQKNGFTLGLQLIAGLPGDTHEKFLKSVEQIVQLGAKETRIYPLLVFSDTPLFEMYQQGKFNPLSVSETVEMIAPAVLLLENAGVKILRIGLHPSEDLLHGEMVAGPWHPAIRQMIYTRAWNSVLSGFSEKKVRIRVSTEQYPNVIGFRRKNVSQFPEIQVQADQSLRGMKYEVDYC